MTTPTPQARIEQRFREIVTEAGLPAPDDVAHLSRAVVFIWYDTKAFVLIDLDELPPNADPFDGLDLDVLRADVTGAPPDPPFIPGGFAETG